MEACATARLTAPAAAWLTPSTAMGLVAKYWKMVLRQYGAPPMPKTWCRTLFSCENTGCLLRTVWMMVADVSTLAASSSATASQCTHTLRTRCCYTPALTKPRRHQGSSVTSPVAQRVLKKTQPPPTQ
jgi:hypothetical protein